MQYHSISADGHVNEPPTLWTDRLPAKFKERGPRVIETRNTKGHAWIMEGQSRPSPMGFSSMYSRASKRFDRASLVDSFKQIRDRGVRYEDVFPGSYDPAERVKEILEDETDAEVIFNGVQTVWNGIKLCPDPELSLACYRVYNDWIAEFQAYAPERFICNGTLPTTGIDDALAELSRCVDMGLRTVQLESYPSGSFSTPSPEDDRFWAAAVELDMPINVHTQFFFPAGDLGSKLSAEGVPEQKARAQKLGVDIAAGSFPAILANMITTGVFERFPALKFVGTEVHTGWVPYYLERFDESVKRNRRDWDLPLLPSEYFRRNVHRRLRRRRVGGGEPLRHRRGEHHVGSRLPALLERVADGLPAGPRDPRAGRRDSGRDRAHHVAERRRPLQAAVRRAGRREVGCLMTTGE